MFCYRMTYSRLTRARRRQMDGCVPSTGFTVTGTSGATGVCTQSNGGCVATACTLHTLALSNKAKEHSRRHSVDSWLLGDAGGMEARFRAKLEFAAAYVATPSQCRRGAHVESLCIRQAIMIRTRNRARILQQIDARIGRRRPRVPTVPVCAGVEDHAAIKHANVQRHVSRKCRGMRYYSHTCRLDNCAVMKLFRVSRSDLESV